MESSPTLEGKGGVFKRTALKEGTAQYRMGSVLTKALGRKNGGKNSPFVQIRWEPREVGFEG